ALVAFSGGKALLGPNDTGLLLGRKDLIEAAKLNTNPHCGCIGRMMKVSKEDMMALLAAVERYVRLDHQAEWREWERRLGVIEQALGRAHAAMRAGRTAGGQPRPAPAADLGREAPAADPGAADEGAGRGRPAHPDREG